MEARKKRVKREGKIGKGFLFFSLESDDESQSEMRGVQSHIYSLAGGV